MVIAGGYPEITGGAKWIGPNGWISIDRDKFTASNVQWIHDIQAREKKGDLKIQLYKSPGHLGYIASVTGRALKWDAVKKEIIGDAEVSKLMQPKMRAPWTL